jgi:hypothetical protein
LFCCRHIGSSDLARPCLRHDCAPNVDVLDFDAAKNHLWSHARAGASRPEMPVRLTIRLRPSQRLTFGAPLEVSTRLSAFAYRDSLSCVAMSGLRGLGLA